MRLIIFDIDGTLCESDNVDDKCYIQAFKEALDLNISDMNWNNYEHVTDSGIAYRIFDEIYNRTPREDEISKLKERYEYLLWKSYNENPGSFREIDGSVNLVRKINLMEDWVTCIASGGWGTAVKMKLKILNLDTLKIPIGNSDYHISKHDIIKLLIEESKAKNKLSLFEKVIYVGDREYDYRTAQGLLIDFIGIDFRRNGLLKKSGAEKVVNNYKDGKFMDFLSS
jgi:phosphoglycolate phosphatase-like HAD superfamily hydrolase